MAAAGGLIFGYDLGVSGGVISVDSFLKKFFPHVYQRMKEDTNISNYCKFDSQLLTLFTSSFCIAGLIASFFASPVIRAFGRKTLMLVAGSAFLAGSALGGAASNIYMLVLGRALLGIGLGFANQINSNNHEEAVRLLQCLRGTNDVQVELDDLVKASSISKTTNNPFKIILQRNYRPQLVMAIAIQDNWPAPKLFALVCGCDSRCEHFFRCDIDVCRRQKWSKSAVHDWGNSDVSNTDNDWSAYGSFARGSWWIKQQVVI
ncbi:hypothetical protein PTKIN_Ptkin05aG0220400 [Pterospermum kingtungense]